MHKLSSAAVVNELPAAPTTTVAYPSPDCCDAGIVHVKAVWSGSTKIFDLRTTDLSEPNAIVDYTLQLGLTA